MSVRRAVRMGDLDIRVALFESFARELSLARFTLGKRVAEALAARGWTYCADGRLSHPDGPSCPDCAAEAAAVENREPGDPA